MARFVLTESELRKAVRKTLVLELTPDIIHSPEDATRHMEQYGHPPIGEWLAAAGEIWNRSLGKFIVKIPGLPGAENYEWSDAAIDIFVLVASGGIAGAALKAVALTSKGAKAARAARAIYVAASRKVGHGAARKAVQLSLKSIGAAPTDYAVKETLKAARDISQGGNISLELTKQEFEQAVSMAKSQGIELMTSDSDIEELGREANQAFGITV